VSVVRWGRRARGTAGIVLAQLTRNRLRTTFAIIGIVLAGSVETLFFRHIIA
jgi:hypothetical protein